eukprot:5792705-Amphidinium_carterae.1
MGKNTNFFNRLTQVSPIFGKAEVTWRLDVDDILSWQDMPTHQVHTTGPEMSQRHIGGGLESFAAANNMRTQPVAQMTATKTLGSWTVVRSLGRSCTPA